MRLPLLSDNSPGHPRENPAALPSDHAIANLGDLIACRSCGAPSARTAPISRRRLLAAGAATSLGGGWDLAVAHGKSQAVVPAATTVPRLLPVAPQVWAARGTAGEASAANRGATSNLLVVADGHRRWLLGSGPTPAWGRQFAAVVRQETGATPSDVIAPWPRPELVLGSAGMGGAGVRDAHLRRWAHRAVDAAMRERCPHCIDRLAARLGLAAIDLEPRSALPALANHLLDGQSGRLGPWRWWLLWRTRTPGALQPVTVWHLPADGLWAAPGLLWTDGPPDLRDSRLADQLQALDALARIRAEVADAARSTHPARAGAEAWWPEQGEPGDASLIATHRHYWQALADAVRATWEGGGNETDAPPALPGVATNWLAHERHALNWQRAWREVEADDAAAPAPSPASAPSGG
ncbi:MAG: hypothetical protein RL722_1627 [Pseudomonadota bacterium]